MANKTGAQLIDTVRLRAGRQNDSVLITEDFVLDALNEGQICIVRKTPRLVDLDKSDTSTYRIATWSTTATTVTAIARDSGVVTVTASGHSLEVGDVVTVAGCTGTVDFNGNFEVATIAGTAFTYFQNAADETGAVFGTVVQLAAKPTYNIATLAPAHIGGIWLLNGVSTRQEGIRYIPLDEFRVKYTPVSEETPSEPTEYTRQGNNIIFNCPISADYAGLKLRIDYTDWATDLANDAVASELSNSNEGLILFALSRVYDEIALSRPEIESKAVKTRVLFENWLQEYQDYQEMLFEELKQ